MDENSRQHWTTNFGSRALDLVIGTIATVIALPIVLVAGLGAAITLRARPLFVQTRIGHRLQPFSMWKVRTLPATVPVDADKYSLADHDIPKFTDRLRRLHIDELPQLVLVLAGTMALVGPRPEMVGLQAQIGDETAMVRSRVRPGCTGLWQISAESRGLIHEATSYDRFYVENRTTRLDLWILWRTAVLLLRAGHYVGLSDVPRWAIRPLTGASPHPAATALSSTNID